MIVFEFPFSKVLDVTERSPPRNPAFFATLLLTYPALIQDSNVELEQHSLRSDVGFLFCSLLSSYFKQNEFSVSF